MKAVGLGLAFTLFGFLATASIGVASPPIASRLRAPIIYSDWQSPLSLPPRFRNHCAIDTFSGRPYCSDHCGFDYQFYYCSRQSFGCCRIGFGYCDWSGLLRCLREAGRHSHYGSSPQLIPIRLFSQLEESWRPPHGWYPRV